MSAFDSFEAEMKTVLNNLNNQVKDIQGKTAGGLLAAGFIVERDAKLNVPVEYGILRDSAITRKAPDNDMAVEVSFNANYAVYVHENMEMKHAGEPRPSGLGVYWGPHGGPKYLERAVSSNIGKILDAIASRAKR